MHVCVWFNENLNKVKKLFNSKNFVKLLIKWGMPPGTYS